MEDKELHALQDELVARSEELENRMSNSNVKRPAKYGLCSTCNSFHYRKTIYDNEIAYCSKWKTIVPKQDRVCECSDYYPFDQPDMYDMVRMAHIIDAKKEKKIGF